MSTALPISYQCALARTIAIGAGTSFSSSSTKVVEKMPDYDHDTPSTLSVTSVGRLGDTFPETFECMDMRARTNVKSLEALVQELGRLCVYRSGVGATRLPYALVVPAVGRILEQARSLEDLIKVKSRAGEVDDLVRRCAGGNDEWDPSTRFTTFLRRAFQATDKSYDYRRSAAEPGTSRNGGAATVQARWHKRRFLLVGEPQRGKTGALVSCIARLRDRVSRPESIEVVDPPPEPDDGGPGPAEAGQLKAPRFPNAADLAGWRNGCLPIDQIALPLPKV